MSTLILLLLAAGGIALLLFLVIVLRLHAFIALLLVSMAVAIAGGVPLPEIADTIREGMGSTLGYIAVVVGVGAMFGELLQVSGGAERIARTLLARFGQRRAPSALALTGLIVATPVFFDVALILFIPLVYSLARRTSQSLLYYAIPLLAGIAVAHAFIPPTPGPVAVAALLDADLGWVILFGLIAGVPATIVGGLLFGRYIAGRIPLEVPEYMEVQVPTEDDRLPSFGLVLTLIGIPLALILLSTVSGVALPEGNTVRDVLSFVGHPFTALIVAALLAFYFLGIRCGYSAAEVQKIATRSLEPLGLIILVTGAGGVFGRVLIATGVGDALAEVMAASNLPIVLLAFVFAAVVRVSQGSATVSMVTAAGLMAPIVEAGTYSAPLIGAISIAIASGATILSHVNDSGFWLVSQFLGMTEKETLRSWTVMETLVGLTGLAVIFVVSLFL
jgi:Gnt-I system low-affinity gluconate transporter